MSEYPPERVWLQVDTDPDSEWHDEIIVTWCEDQIHETDPEYILATRAAELEKDFQQVLLALTLSREQCHKLERENERLKAQLTKRKKWTRFLRKEMKIGDGLFGLMTEKGQEWQGKCFKLQAENERLREGLEKLDAWAKAYPLDIFAEPDMKKAAEILRENGMTLDAISASNMRHMLSRTQEIVSAALKEGE